MIWEILMPIMGTTIVQRKIVEWAKSPGDKVNKGDTIFIAESDKADMDVESFNNGYLAVILAQAGETVTFENPVVGLLAETEAEIPLAKQRAKLMRQQLAAEAEEIPDRTTDKTPLRSRVPVMKLERQINTATFNDFFIENKLKGLTMTGLLTKIVAQTLVKYPLLNARLTPTLIQYEYPQLSVHSFKKGIEYNSQIDINMPVYLASGKTVFPTLFDVGRTDLFSLSLTCLKLASRAIDNKLKPEQYNRGNITIINLGISGVDRFDTALFEGQSCTITFGTADNAVSNTGFFELGKPIKVSLISDRRIIDWALGQAFLEDLDLLFNNKPLLSEL